MPEPRPQKRLRRQITDTSAEDEDEDAPSEYDLDTIYVASNEPSKQSSPQISAPSIAMSRSRRSAATPANLSPSVTVTRSPSDSPEENRRSIKLNFKMPASKLREVTGMGNPSSRAGRVAASLRDSFGGGEIISGPRRSRNQQQKKYVDYNEDDDDDEDEEEEEEEEEDDEDAEGEEEDDDLDDFERIGAEAEGGTDDEDIEMRDAPAPATVKLKVSKPPLSTAKAPSRGAVGRPVSKQVSRSASRPIASQVAPVRAVEVKEMEDEPDDEEVLSDLDDDDEEDEEEEDDDEVDDDEEDADGEEDERMNDTTLPMINEPDAEGEEDGEGEEDDDDEGSDEELGMNEDGSRASTPDYARLTKRQRGRGVEEDGSFMALPMEPQIKKHFTAEEHRMRRAEMARRRKNLSEKRNEEEKMTTINKLLKKQANKKRGKSLNAEHLAAAEAAERRGGSGADATAGQSQATSDVDEEEMLDIDPAVPKPDPLFIRWVSGAEGVRLGVPVEWEGKTGLGPGLGLLGGNGNLNANRNGISRMVEQV